MVNSLVEVVVSTLPQGLGGSRLETRTPPLPSPSPPLRLTSLPCPLSVSCLTPALYLSLRNSPPEKGNCDENQSTTYRLPPASGTTTLSILDTIGNCLRNKGFHAHARAITDATTTTSFTLQLYTFHLIAASLLPRPSYPNQATPPS